MESKEFRSKVAAAVMKGVVEATGATTDNDAFNKAADHAILVRMSAKLGVSTKKEADDADKAVLATIKGGIPAVTQEGLSLAIDKKLALALRAAETHAPWADGATGWPRGSASKA